MTPRSADSHAYPTMSDAFRRIVSRILRSGLLTTGAILLTLGAGNWSVGRVKLAQYERLAAQTRTAVPDPVPLRSAFTFTNVSEDHERHNIAVAKLHYYSVVLTAGQVLVVAGVTLLLVGYARRSGRVGVPNRTLLDST